MRKRVAILGAGPSGLALLQAFETARKSGAEIPHIVCYEKQGDWGGLWNYTWRTGLDSYGEPVHSSMYRYLWSNGPKECLELADYTLDQHFGRPVPSFPPRAALRDYFLGRVKQSGVRPLIRFHTAVQWVDYCPERKVFTVTTRDLLRQRLNSNEYDHVVVASGHYSTPNTPDFPGLDQFSGRVLHAHDFRDAREFAGQHLLLIGSSYSAEDIALQCHKYGAGSVTISHRSEPMGFNWPEGISEAALLERVEGRTAHFVDGSQREVDAILLCTGYLHHFPFLPDSLALRTGNRMYPPGLYKGVVFARNPDLLYLGMQDQYFTFNMFDAQAWFARDLLLDRITLPEPAAMSADMEHWLTREAELETAEEEIDFQAAYMRDLLDRTDYPALDVEAMADQFKQWLQHKQECILGYREQRFPSTLTGTLAAAPNTSWLQALDDSSESWFKPEAEETVAEPRRVAHG